MRPTPQPQHIHLVVNLNESSKNKGEIWASKYLPCSGAHGSRFKYWQINSMLEVIEGTTKTVSWDSAHTGQAEQLKAALGSGFVVLEQWEALQAVTDYQAAKVG